MSADITRGESTGAAAVLRSILARIDSGELAAGTTNAAAVRNRIEGAAVALEGVGAPISRRHQRRAATDGA